MAPTAAPGRRHLALALTAVAVVVVVVTGACGVAVGPAAGPAQAATLVVAPVLRPGEAVPAPSDAPVLTVTGRIAQTNAASSLTFDPATLDRLGLLRLTVFEPWVEETLEYQGVWLEDVLEIAQADAAAESIHVTALDDYQVDVRMSDIRAGGIFLATKAGNGAPIPIEEGGPTRIVYPDGVAAGASPDQWIWSLTTIDVR